MKSKKLLKFVKKGICFMLVMSMVYMTASEMMVTNAADYSATSNHGFEIGEATNEEPYWYRKKSELHYTDRFLAYKAFVYVGYSTHKGSVNVEGKKTYHDDIMVKVELVPQKFTTYNQLGIKCTYQGYPEYYSVNHTLKNDIVAYSPKRTVPSNSYSISINAGSDKKVGISGTINNITEDALEVSVSKDEKTATFKYNYVASFASQFKNNKLFKYCSGTTEQLNSITVSRTKNKKYNDTITTYGTAGYQYGIYVWQTGKSGGGEYTFAINRQ